MDTYQSPLQILSQQQENHQSQINCHQQVHQHNQHHQQVYLIEFQQQHHHHQMATAASLDHHLHHHHLQHQHLQHHQHHHVQQQQQQHQQQQHQHHHHLQHHYHHELQPQAATMMNGSAHQLHVSNGESLINGLTPCGDKKQQDQPHHLQPIGQEAPTLLNGATTNNAATAQLQQQAPHFGGQGDLVARVDVNSVGLMPGAVESNGTIVPSMAPTSVGTLMIDPYSGHTHHTSTGSAMTLAPAPTGGSPSDVHQQQPHHLQHAHQEATHIQHTQHQDAAHLQHHQQQHAHLHLQHQQQHLHQEHQLLQQQQTIHLQPQQTNLAGLVTTVPQQQQLQHLHQHHQQHAQQQQIAANQTPNTATSTTPNPVRRKRKRCGVCPGCEHKDNCGECGPCKSARSHQICKMRKCDRLKHKRQQSVIARPAA